MESARDCRLGERGEGVTVRVLRAGGCVVEGEEGERVCR